MRATISFETDVDQVEGTMAVIACEEEHNLRAAADILGNYTVLDGSLLDTITEVLRLLDLSTTQLRQYREMMLNFERVRLGVAQPQQESVTEDSNKQDANSFAEVKQIIEDMRSFDTFLSQLPEEDQLILEVENDEPDQEG